MDSDSDSEFGDLAAVIESVGNQEGIENEDESDNEEIEKPKIPKRKIIIDPVEKEELGKFLFGDRKGLFENLEGEKLFFSDLEGANKVDNVGSSEAVWEDDDSDEDQSAAVIPYKKKRITDANRPTWADPNRKVVDDDSDEEITSHLSVAPNSTSKELPKGELNFKRLKNVNKTTMKEGHITGLEFHSQSTVGIVAGLKGFVSIFAIDGTENKK